MSLVAAMQLSRESLGAERSVPRPVGLGRLKPLGRSEMRTEPPREPPARARTFAVWLVWLRCLGLRAFVVLLSAGEWAGSCSL